METFRKHGVYETILIKAHWEETDKRYAGRRVGGHRQRRQGETPEYRCRLVAKEIKKDKREGLFAAMPQLESKKMLFSLWDSMPGARLGLGDVARASFRARARTRVHAELSKEDFEEGKRGMLKKAMCEIRDAAQNCGLEYAGMTTEADFRQGSFS